MKKLVRGVLQFRRTRLESYRREFAHLALGQKPDSLFIACGDSRVVPNTFASCDPGDLFVVRNVGNIVTPAEGPDGRFLESSEAAAIQFALGTLGVRDIIVCGHSSCGAMNTLRRERDEPGSCDCSSVSHWLQYARPLLTCKVGPELEGMSPKLSEVDALSQRNVLLQIEHLKTHGIVRARLAEGILRIHAWWFDLQNADVHVYDVREKAFRLLDETSAAAVLEEGGIQGVSYADRFFLGATST
ncbi:MAG: carbonic anhydrase [Silvanigrellales bacterium]|nr:carbonic anhydrase [Silvanigrellales bacterium]